MELGRDGGQAMGVAVMWIALEQVERVRAELAALPERPVEKVPCKQAIGLLSPQIRELRLKGYSRKEIAAALTANGLPVSETVLRSYERGAGDTSNRSRGGRGRKGASGSRQGVRAESVAAAGAKAPVPKDEGHREPVPELARSGDGAVRAGGASPGMAADARTDCSGSEAAAELRAHSGAAGRVSAADAPSHDGERKSKFALRNDTEDL
jgi:hypothetical protein